MYYIDTSVLTAYYCPEPLSEKAEKIIITSGKPAISSLTHLELFSAISKKVREGLHPEDGNKIIRQFEYHLIEQKLYRQLDIDEHHYTMAANWVAQFNTPLRSLDGLHLAVSSAAQLNLLTADIKLAEAARFFGLEVTLLTAD